MICSVETRKIVVFNMPILTEIIILYLQGGEEEHENRPLDSPDARFMACCQARQLVKHE